MKISGSLVLLLVLPGLAASATRHQQELARTLAMTPDRAHGAELFERCAACHGVDGGGTSNGSVPRIAGQHDGVLIRQIIDFRLGRRWDMRMEGVVTSHDAIPNLQDVADVASYVSQLERNGKRGVGDGLNLELGAAIYAKSCASCHGPEGQGDGEKAIPRLAGQHAGYLVRQIYDAVDGRRPPLTTTHRARFAPLVFDEVLGIGDYLSRIGWKMEPGTGPVDAADAKAPDR